MLLRPFNTPRPPNSRKSSLWASERVQRRDTDFVCAAKHHCVVYPFPSYALCKAVHALLPHYESTHARIITGESNGLRCPKIHKRTSNEELNIDISSTFIHYTYPQLILNKMPQHNIDLSPSRSLKLGGLVSKLADKGKKLATTSTKDRKYHPLTHTSSKVVRKDYDSNILVEPATPPFLINQHRYPSLRALKTDEEIGDGIWVCCQCRHENILRHYRGQFPFKHLICHNCERALCPNYLTTEIASPIPSGLTLAPRPSKGQELRYFQTCPSCGLSHRAEMGRKTEILDFCGITCAGCGAISDGDWPRVRIGSVEPYRRDPDASSARLDELRGERAAQQLCCSDQTDMDR
jgi:hypothetical protein